MCPAIDIASPGFVPMPEASIATGLTSYDDLMSSKGHIWDSDFPIQVYETPQGDEYLIMLKQPIDTFYDKVHKGVKIGFVDVRQCFLHSRFEGYGGVESEPEGNSIDLISINSELHLMHVTRLARGLDRVRAKVYQLDDAGNQIQPGCVFKN